MKKRTYLVVLAAVVLCGAVGLGAADRAWADDGFYVIAASTGTFKGNWDGAATYKAKDIVFIRVPAGSAWPGTISTISLISRPATGPSWPKRAIPKHRTDWTHWTHGSHRRPGAARNPGGHRIDRGHRRY